jgi:Ala-tRNA(Pro) deacylase
MAIDIEQYLERIGVAYQRFDHAPVFTCDEADAAVPTHSAVQTKNLFFRDKRGRRHLLLVTTCATSVDIDRFTEQAHADRLSFGSPERLMKYLGVTPGSVTVLGLVHDTAHAVELYVDAVVWNAAEWKVHPLVNSATLVVSRAGIEAFLAATGHAPRVLVVPTKTNDGRSH